MAAWEVARGTFATNQVSKPAAGQATAPMATVVTTVLEQLGGLTGRLADGVSAVRKTDQGWHLLVDVVEVERVPATTNLLATLEVEADSEGNVTSYERVRRFYRNAADDS